MNFFDYELSRNATATPPATGGETSTNEQQSLNDEVNEVVGQLGRLWGGFRKQSQVAFETARKDLSSVVEQAQKEIGKLSTPGQAEAGPSGSTPTDPSASRLTDDTSDVTTPKGNEGELPQSPSTSATPSASFQFQSILSKVQSSLPPNLASTLESTIPAALKQNPNIDFTSLRTSLGAEFARVQGVTRAQAEEYAHKSEALLREAGEYLKDAVKVLPPEGGEHGAADGVEPEVMLDSMGLGVVVMPPGLGSQGPGVRDAIGIVSRAKGKGRQTQSQSRTMTSSRVASMVSQLKRDPEVIKRNPLDDPETKAMYENWYKAEVAAREGGITSEYWIGKTKEVLSQKEDKDALESTRDTLVMNTMDPETFWTRYFFRMHQIEKDEEKRKALLATSGEGTDEDFSWEDDEDESGTPSDASENERQGTRKSVPSTPGVQSKKRASCDTLQPVDKNAATASYPESLVNSPSFTGSRASSEGYDVVSNGSPSDSKKGEQKGKEEEEEEEEDGDSDWE